MDTAQRIRLIRMIEKIEKNVKNFLLAQKMNSQQSNAEPLSEVQNVNFQKSKIRTSKSPKNKLLEVQNMDHNNTYNINTDNNKTDDSNLI